MTIRTKALLLLLSGLALMVIAAGCGGDDDDDAEPAEPAAAEATFCVGEEFATRDDGLAAFERAYDVEVPRGDLSTVGDAVVYPQVASGDRCNFGSVFATDGQIRAQDLRVLEDDEDAFAKYNPALNVREEVMEEHPEIEELFTPVAEALETEAMQEMNAAVDAEGERVEDVAEEFLQEEGLIEHAEGIDLSGAQVTVGSKEFTEQLILGQMTIDMLEAAGAEVADQTGLEGSVVARQALVRGETDMYWEYTGTAWLTFFNEDEAIPDEQEQYEAVRDQDLEENQIVWLEPAPFDNTYAIAVREDAGDELDDVETLSDLAELVREDEQG